MTASSNTTHSLNTTHLSNTAISSSVTTSPDTVIPSGVITSPDAKANIAKDKLSYIDALRGIACLSILVYHFSDMLYSANVDVPSMLDPFFRFAGYAVPLFFIVSSFTLYLSLEAKKDEKNRFIKFYIRRLFRIAPLFYAVLVFFLIRMVIALHSPPSAPAVLTNILFVFNLFPSYFESIIPTGWTVGVEMLFYLWLPLIFISVSSLRRSLAFVLVAILISHLTNLLLPEIFVGQYATFNFFSQLPVFAIGVVCYFIYKYYIPKIQSSYRVPVSLLLLLTSFALFYSLATYLLYYIPSEIFFSLSLPSWQAVGFSFLLLSLSLFSNGLIVNRVTRFFGKISYSIYLVHPLLIQSLIPVYGYVGHSSLPIMVSIGLCLLLSILITTPIAMLTYRYIESPGMRYGKKVASRL